MVGPEGIKQAGTLFRRAFPDLTYAVEEEMAERDLVWDAMVAVAERMELIDQLRLAVPEEVRQAKRRELYRHGPESHRRRQDRRVVGQLRRARSAPAGRIGAGRQWTVVTRPWPLNSCAA